MGHSVGHGLHQGLGHSLLHVLSTPCEDPHELVVVRGQVIPLSSQRRLQGFLTDVVFLRVTGLTSVSSSERRWMICCVDSGIFPLNIFSNFLQSRLMACQVSTLLPSFVVSKCFSGQLPINIARTLYKKRFSINVAVAAFAVISSFIRANLPSSTFSFFFMFVICLFSLGCFSRRLQNRTEKHWRNSQCSLLCPSKCQLVQTGFRELSK